VVSLESIVADRTPDLDKEVGALRKKLDSTELSAAIKLELRERIELVQKDIIEARKRLLAQRVDNCLKVVKDEVESTLRHGARSLVLKLDIGANLKASQKIVKEVQKNAPSLAFMGVSEEDGSRGKVICFAVVPEVLLKETGLKADKWLMDVVESVGGNGGGKPGIAMGQIPQCNDVDMVISNAIRVVNESISVVS
jgi:alanyl-tRNA synthetase